MPRYRPKLPSMAGVQNTTASVGLAAGILVVVLTIASAFICCRGLLFPPPLEHPAVHHRSFPSPPQAHTEASPDPTHPSSTAAPVNAVILFLYGGRSSRYFVREALPRLERHWLRCYPYPLHIFHTGITNTTVQQIRAAVPSAPRVDFEDVSAFWGKLPHGITEAQLSQWMADGVQPKFQGRGYRQMCRFWSGPAWLLPSLSRYEYYLRLDTDSIIPSPVKLDPFEHFVSRRCSYGYNRLKGENPHVLTRLYQTFQKWLANTDSLAESEKAEVQSFVTKFATDNVSGEYWGPMYYNNFEMARFAVKRNSVYQSMFEYFDGHEPFGFLRYRWGDAPFHTLGIAAVLRGKDVCVISKTLVPYRHAVDKPPPLVEGSGCNTRAQQ